MRLRVMPAQAGRQPSIKFIRYPAKAQIVTRRRGYDRITSRG